MLIPNDQLMTFDLHFLHSSAEPCCTALVDKHFENYWTLQLMTEGALELIYADQLQELRCDHTTAWFWPAYPGPRIRFHVARDFHSWNHRYLAFAGPLALHWQRSGLWPMQAQVAPRGPGQAAQFDALLHEAKRGGTWGTRRAINLLEGLLLELAEARATGTQEPEWLTRCRQDMAADTEFAPNYERLARQLGMGLSTLRRRFKDCTGTTLHEAAMRHRLEKARKLLAETDLPIKAIAAAIGYRDVYFFSNQFKHLTGVTPAMFRRSRQS